MKKLLTSIICLFAIYATAQITYGAKAGVNVSKISNLNTGSVKRVGLYAGGFASIPLSEDNYQFFVQPELLFSMMGEKRNGVEDVNINYLIAPVLFKTYFSEQDTEFFGEIGPQFGFLVGKNIPNDQNSWNYNSFDYGATVGLGFSYLRTWEASARFYYGLADMVENDPQHLKNINSNVNFGIAYRF